MEEGRADTDTGGAGGAGRGEAGVAEGSPSKGWAKGHGYGNGHGSHHHRHGGSWALNQVRRRGGKRAAQHRREEATAPCQRKRRDVACLHRLLSQTPAVGCALVAGFQRSTIIVTALSVFVCSLFVRRSSRRLCGSAGSAGGFLGGTSGSRSRRGGRGGSSGRRRGFSTRRESPRR